MRDHASERLDGVVKAVAFVLIAGLASLSQRQTAVWHDSVSLFNHAIAVTSNNAEAYAHLGVAYLRQDKPSDAITPLERAVEIRPGLKEAHTSLGVAYRMIGQPERAVVEHEKSLGLDPDQAAVRANLGIALIDLRRFDEAERQLRDALRRDPTLDSAQKALDALVAARSSQHPPQ